MSMHTRRAEDGAKAVMIENDGSVGDSVGEMQFEKSKEPAKCLI